MIPKSRQQMKRKKGEKKLGFFLPYFQSTTDRISRIMNRHNIKVIFKGNLRRSSLLFPNSKDRRPHLENLTHQECVRFLYFCGKVHRRNRENDQYTDQRTPAVRQVLPSSSISFSPNTGWRTDTPCYTTKRPCLLHYKAIFPESIARVLKSLNIPITLIVIKAIR